jgi:hypothetical protein
VILSLHNHIQTNTDIAPLDTEHLYLVPVYVCEQEFLTIQSLIYCHPQYAITNLS